MIFYQEYLFWTQDLSVIFLFAEIHLRCCNKNKDYNGRFKESSLYLFPGHKTWEDLAILLFVHLQLRVYFANLKNYKECVCKKQKGM